MSILTERLKKNSNRVMVKGRNNKIEISRVRFSLDNPLL
jgi:hypothetical protein